MQKKKMQNEIRAKAIIESRKYLNALNAVNKAIWFDLRTPSVFRARLSSSTISRLTHGIFPLHTIMLHKFEIQTRGFRWRQLKVFFSISLFFFRSFAMLFLKLDWMFFGGLIVF